MNVEKSKLRMSFFSKEENVKSIVEDDVIVRDVNPDILNIIEVSGVPYIRDKKKDGEKIIVSGSIRYNIIYIADEEEKNVHSMQGEIGFIEKFESESNVDEIDTDIKLEYLQGTLLNSRKVNLKTIIHISVDSNGEYDEDVVTNVLNEPNIQKIEKRMKNCIHVEKIKERFLEKEKFVVPANKPYISEILKTDVRLNNVDVNSMGDELLVTGNLVLMILYNSDETDAIDFIEFNMPIRESIKGSYDDVTYDIKLDIENIDLHVEEDNENENRLVNFETVLNCKIDVIGSQEMTILDDIYSLDTKLAVGEKDMVYDVMVCQNKNSYNIREMIKIDKANIMQVYNVYAKIDIENITVKNNITEISGVIQAKTIYVVADDNMPLNSHEIEIPFTQLVDTKSSREGMKCFATAKVEDINFNMLNPTEIEVRFEITLNAKVLEENKENMIISIEREDAPIESRMSMVICVADAEKRLWDVAKNYNASLEHIKLQNDHIEIKPDTIIAKGEKILIL